MNARRILTAATASVVVAGGALAPIGSAADGAIQAGVSIEGVNHSIGSARRGTNCYTGASEIKGGRIATLKNNEVVRKGAKVGRTFTVKVFTRDGRSVTKKLTLRAERKGDDSGKPPGCWRGPASAGRGCGPAGARHVYGRPRARGYEAARGPGHA